MLNLFFKPTVDSVLGKFQKMVNDLHNIAADNIYLASKNEETIEQLQLLNTSLRYESDRALKVADKISSLIDG